MAEDKKMQFSATENWRNMSSAKKASFTVLAGSLLIAFILFVRHFSAPPMAVLFSGMSPDNAAMVLARLEESAVPHEIGAGGGSILVPSNQVDELRIRLNSDGGLYGSGVGFELFDQTRLGVTEAERRLNYQRALQGELQRTISQIDGVSQARVHLVLPEPSVFLREATPPTASIVLKLDPLSRLRNDQVAGIVYLVAGSVENLTTEHITVIDTQGRLLTDRSDSGLAGGGLASATLHQMEIRREFERDMEHRLQSMLERVLGAGTVAAMVTAELDFNSREVTELTYGQPVVRSRQRTEESFEGGGEEPAGQAGTDSNIPAYPYTLGAGGSSRQSRLDEVENFELPETLTRTVTAPGEIRNISASIIYDNRKGTLSPRQIEEVETLVASAIGFSEGRDTISVAAINFDTTQLDETLVAMEEAAALEQRNTYIRYGVTAFAVLIAFLLVLTLLRGLFSFLGTRSVPQETAVTIRQEVKSLSWDNVPDEVKKQRQVREIVSQQPEAAYNMLKLWMAEE